MPSNYSSVAELIMEDLNRQYENTQTSFNTTGNVVSPGTIGSFGKGGGSPVNLGSLLAPFQRTAMRNNRSTRSFNVNDAFRNRPIEGYFLKPEARQAILENRLTSSDGQIRKGIGIAPPRTPGQGGPV